MPTHTTPALYPGGLTRHQAVAWRNAVFAIFAVTGIGIASWMARTPAIKETLHASTSEMGTLILGVAFGSITGLLASSHVIAKLGTRAVITWCISISPLGLMLAGVGVTVFESFGLTFAGLLIFGFGMALCDVAMNLSGAVNERVLGRTIMPIFHAFFSFGTMLGAGLGYLAELAAVPIVAQAIVVGALLIAGGLASVRFLHSEHLLTAKPEPGATPAESTWRSRLAIWRDPRTIMIGLIVLGMAFAEGSANDWLALTMVEGHHVDKPTGALVFGIFVTAMTVGRLAGVRVLDRFGRVPVLRASAVLATAGLLLVIFVPVVWIAIVGVVLWGLGAALGFPTGMSAAADDPATAVARVSAVATIGYVAFLVGPPAIGYLGEHFGLLNALLLVLALLILAGIASGAAREPHGAEATGPGA